MSAALIPFPLSVRQRVARVDLGASDGLRIAVDGELFPVVAALARVACGIGLVPADAADAAVIVEIDAFDEVEVLPLPAGVVPSGDAAFDERYTLAAGDGVVHIRARHSAGALRGLTAFLQLADVSEHVTVPETHIADAPRFAWRGLSLDVARCFFAAAELQQVVDLLAWHRMNVLHLHLSDSQAWRLESQSHPHLTDGVIAYSAAQLRALDTYARARGVILVPELDMPGHTRAAIAAYPGLARSSTVVGVRHPGIPYLDPDVPGVADFARDVLTELAAATAGPFLHIGGDEAFGMPPEAYARFVRIVTDHVHALGRRVVGWQEATRSGALGGDDVAQLWISPHDPFDPEALKATTPVEHHPLIDLAARTFAEAPGDLARAVASDVPVLVSSTWPLYLDRRYAEPTGCDDQPHPADPAQTERAARLGFAGYEPQPLSRFAAWDPAAHAAQELPGARIAGIEAAVWCESVTSFDDLAFLLLPRLAILAERAWHPVDRDWPATLARLAAHGPVWDRLGFAARFRPAGSAAHVARAGTEAA